jgi:hypothetical protein
MPRPLVFSARTYPTRQGEKPTPFRLYQYDITTQRHSLLTPTQQKNDDVQQQYSDTRPALSPDATAVLFLRQQGLQRRLWVRDLPSGKERVLLSREPSSFGWVDNNKTCWVAASEGALEYRVHLINSNTGKTTRTLVGDYEPIWSADKTQYAFSEKEGEWRIISVRGNKPTTLALTPTTLLWGTGNTFWALGTPGQHAPTGNLPQEIVQISTAGKLIHRSRLVYKANADTPLRTRLTASWYRLIALPHIPNTLLLYGRMTPSRYLAVQIATETGEVTPWGEFGGQLLPLNAPYAATLGDTTDIVDANGTYQRVRNLCRIDVKHPETLTPLVTGLVQVHSVSD